MEGGLFLKYQVLVKAAEKDKEEIINFLQESIGMNILGKNIKISGKSVILTLSSGERTAFILKGGDKILKEKGYTVVLR